MVHVSDISFLVWEWIVITLLFHLPMVIQKSLNSECSSVFVIKVASDPFFNLGYPVIPHFGLRVSEVPNRS